MKQLVTRDWQRRLHTVTKIQVYQAVVLSALLYMENHRRFTNDEADAEADLGMFSIFGRKRSHKKARSAERAGPTKRGSQRPQNVGLSGLYMGACCDIQKFSPVNVSILGVSVSLS